MSYAVGQITSTEFNVYSLLLAISGTVLIVMAAIGFGDRHPVARAINGAVGIAFVAYAFYLQFIFGGGTVFASYYVFVVPVLLVLQALRSHAEAKRAASASPTSGASAPAEPAPPQPGEAD